MSHDNEEVIVKVVGGSVAGFERTLGTIKSGSNGLYAEAIINNYGIRGTAGDDEIIIDVKNLPDERGYGEIIIDVKNLPDECRYLTIRVSVYRGTDR